RLRRAWRVFTPTLFVGLAMGMLFACFHAGCGCREVKRLRRAWRVFTPTLFVGLAMGMLFACFHAGCGC
ncbi:hypothetical protein CJ430_31800, partial [Klebsiella pneumoniae]